MTPTLIASLALAAQPIQPAFSYDRPFVYNSAATLEKDSFLFPLVASYFSPQMIRRNSAFGLTDDLTIESSLLLFMTGITNMRIKSRMVNTPNFILSLAPELVYSPDFDGQNQDYTVLGISMPMTIKVNKGTFLSVSPGYRAATKGITGMRQDEAEDILRFGVNQPWVDVDYLRVIDDYSAVALQVHYTLPVGGTTLDNGSVLEPLPTFTGKMEYLRAIGQSTRLGVAVLYNPLWIPMNRVAPEGRPDADFLPQLSIWWRIPVGKKAQKKKKAARPAAAAGGVKTSAAAERLRKAPIALPIPAAPAAPAAAQPAPAPAPTPAPAPAPSPQPEPAPAPAPPTPDDK